MSAPSEMSERHGRALARLAELSMALAEDLQARALAAETPDEAARLAGAFQKVARGVRQTMALEARLSREGVREAREAAAEDARTRPTRILERVIQVRREVERLIWTEVGNPDDAEIGVSILADIVDEFSLAPDFLDTTLEVQVQRLKDEIFYHLKEDYEEDDPEWEAQRAEGLAARDPPLQNTG